MPQPFIVFVYLLNQKGCLVHTGWRGSFKRFDGVDTLPHSSLVCMVVEELLYSLTKVMLRCSYGIVQVGSCWSGCHHITLHLKPSLCAFIASTPWSSTVCHQECHLTAQNQRHLPHISKLMETLTQRTHLHSVADALNTSVNTFNTIHLLMLLWLL